MGVKLKDFIKSKTITLDELNGKILAIDAHNMLYQFITTIRQRDGSLLVNSRGMVTSHLNGLFYRCTSFIERGMKLAFVFDGKAPALKSKEIERRKGLKIDAQLKFEAAQKKGDIDAMRMYGSRTAVLTKEMIEESKELLLLLGIPVVQAPSEGEAQAAYMTSRGDAFAAVSQDYDSLLSGSERVVRNLSIEGKRKRNGKFAYDIVKPELILLSDVLNSLGVDREQLIVMAILIGTDYNPKGVPGIGPQKALKLVKSEKDFDRIFEKIEWKKHFDVDWKEIFYTIKDMPVLKDYKLQWSNPDIEGIRALLVEKHDFSAERVEQKLKKFVEEKDARKQMGLGRWV